MINEIHLVIAIIAELFRSCVLLSSRREDPGYRFGPGFWEGWIGSGSLSEKTFGINICKGSCGQRYNALAIVPLYKSGEGG